MVMKKICIHMNFVNMYVYDLWSVCDQLNLNPFPVVRFTGSTREVNKFQLNSTK